MLHLTKTVFIVLLLTITSLANSQESSGGRLPSVQRYEGTPDLPNGIAFFMTLQLLDHFNTEFGPSHAASIVEAELGLSNVESHAFVSQSLTTLYLINTDVKVQNTLLACQFAGPNVDKKDKYAALQQMSDIQKAIYDHYYDQTKASLDADTGRRLQEWMEEAKLSTIHVETDFEMADQQSGGDSTVTLSTMCGGPIG